jgi:hypothetical protein
MRLVGLAVAGLLLGAVPASAQYIPRPVVPIGPPSGYDVAEIVHAMGLDPIGAPMRNGPFFVQRAVDDLGRVLRVTVDARRSQVIAVEAIGPVPYGRFAGYGPHRRPYPGYAAFPSDDDDDFDLAPPGSIMGARMPPDAVTPSAPPRAATPKPVTKSANAAPVPRKRPAAAPQGAAGSVEPLPAQGAPAQGPPATPSLTPPVTPLE